MTKSLGFTDVFCNNLDVMKWFYSEVLHLDIIWNDDRSIAYDIAGHQFSIFFNEHYKLPPEVFSVQPGWPGGTEIRTSWSFQCNKEDFNTIEITCT